MTKAQILRQNYEPELFSVKDLYFLFRDNGVNSEAEKYFQLWLGA